MSDKKYFVLKWSGFLFLFCLLFYLSMNNAFNSSLSGAPDEVMRFEIPKYIFEHGMLPRGDEEKLINNVWGISYGFTPYLPSIFSAIFMKITSFYRNDSHSLIVAARFISVLSGVGTWYFCTKIGEAITKNKSIILLFTCLVCFLPQFIYLCTYLNNDAFSVFCSAWILYAWIKNKKEDWRVSGCIFLGIGIGFMALTYYYAYAFILCSMFVYFYDTIKKKKSVKEILTKASIVFFTAFGIAGWYFVRNYIMYQGDFLGMSYEESIAEKHAIDALKPSLRETPASLGLSFKQTFLTNEVYSTPWIVCSVMSFIGFFGGLAFRMHTILYGLYCALIGLGMLGFIVYFFKNKEKDNTILFNLFLCMVIPVLLSMYYSYNSDYQAQGRYFISALIPLMYFVSFGLPTIFKKKTSYLTFVWFLLMAISISVYLIPNCL